jgi:ABC-type polar amino acid transport system ATPase subunit
MITVKGLEKSFGETHVLRGIDHQQARGEAAVLIGPSGCGKSTFLRCLNLLETPTAGTIILDGITITGGGGDAPAEFEERQRQARRRTGMVFQSFTLFPHRTVLENVIEAPIHVKGLQRAEAVESGMNLLRKVGLEARSGFLPGALSGGQQQRVAIARALAMQPDIMLFDEPTSALDPELREEVLEVIRQLRDEGMTMLIVTHEMEFARQIAHQVLFFDGGLVVEAGPPERVFGAPSQERTRAFLRKIIPNPAS